MKIAVTDFQSIGEASIDATGLTVIVGPSDRGKSALLRAIESALFNRPGDQFVRVGAKTAKVWLATIPGDAMSIIEWEKGNGINKFKLAGEDFSRVGKGVPAPLQTMGFRDVVVGARDKDGKLEGGETLRPQVADQFNPEFVLDRSGAFIAELLIRVSRLGVVQKAGRLCTADLRTKKALVKTRTEDLAVATARMELLTPIEPLRECVVALAQRGAALVKWGQQIAALKAVLFERRVLLARTKAKLPKPTSRGALDVLVADGERLARLRALVEERARLTSLPKLPRVRKASKVAAQTQELFTALRPLMIERRQQLNWIDEAERELARVDMEVARLTQWLAQIKAEVRVCPVCERPWPS